MALRYADAEWDPPSEKLEGESTKIPIPKEPPPFIPKPPKILGEVETRACYGWFTLARYVPDHDSGRWVPKIDVTSTPTQYTDLLTDNSRFSESQKGVFSVRNGKTQQQVTNARVRVDKIRRVWHTENDFDDSLICRVSCKEAWGEETQEIEIKKSEYKNLFKKIHQKWPSVFLSTQDGDSWKHI